MLAGVPGSGAEAMAGAVNGLEAKPDGLALPHCAKGKAIAYAAGLRVRAAPVDGAILGKLILDEPLTIWAVENGWAIVQTDTADPLHPELARLTGWASMAYLQVGDLSP